MDEPRKEISMYIKSGVDELGLHIHRWSRRRKLPREELNEEIANIMQRILLICNSIDPDIIDRLHRKLMTERY